MKMYYTSEGFPVRCKCNEWANWRITKDSGEVIYLCQRCYEKYSKEHDL